MRPLLVLLAASSLLALPAAAHEYARGGLTIGHPWARPAAKGMNGAAYLSVTNKGAAADTLVAAESPAAARVELHQTTMTGAVASMKPVTAGLSAPAGKTVALSPGGAHLMMFGLKQQLVEGARIPLTLTFAKAGKVKVELAVEAAGPQPKPVHKGH